VHNFTEVSILYRHQLILQLVEVTFTIQIQLQTYSSSFQSDTPSSMYLLWSGMEVKTESIDLMGSWISRNPVVFFLLPIYLSPRILSGFPVFLQQSVGYGTLSISLIFHVISISRYPCEGSVGMNTTSKISSHKMRILHPASAIFTIPYRSWFPCPG
jgi:hypothetical protein